jgi:hypothetical protein
MIVSLNGGAWTALFALLTIIMVSSSFTYHSPTGSLVYLQNWYILFNRISPDITVSGAGAAHGTLVCYTQLPHLRSVLQFPAGQSELAQPEQEPGEVHTLGGSSLPLANITFAKVDIDVERCVVDDRKPVSTSALPTQTYGMSADISSNFVCVGRPKHVRSKEWLHLGRARTLTFCPSCW